nr:hypothetical protein [Tanacetum cinerariifolium]
METLLYGRDTLKLEYMVAILNSKELQKITEAKGDGGEGLYVRGKSSQRDIEQGTYSVWSKSQGRSSRLMCYICQSKKHLKRDCPRYNYKKSKGFVMNKIRRDFLVDFKEYDGNKILLGDGRECRVRGTGTTRGNYIYTLDGQIVTRKTLKGRKQLGEYHTRWKIKTGNVLDSCNHSIKQGMLEPAKVKCIFMGYRKGIMDNKLKRLYDVTSNVVLYKNVSFNESKEYRKTFVGSGVEDSNKAAFAVAAMDKIYAHESLTFNDTVSYETLLEGHSILSLEGNLSGDCDVEKN